jgi:hypothetical protein
VIFKVFPAPGANPVMCQVQVCLQVRGPQFSPIGLPRQNHLRIQDNPSPGLREHDGVQIHLGYEAFGRSEKFGKPYKEAHYPFPIEGEPPKTFEKGVGSATP